MKFKETFEVVIDQDLEEIMPAFLGNRQKDLDQIGPLIEANELGKIRVIAHKLAGNAGSYGLIELGEIGAAMEEACIASDKAKIQELFEDYKNFMQNLTIKFE